MLLSCRWSVVTLQWGLFSALARCSHPSAPMLLSSRLSVVDVAVGAL